MSLPLPFEVVTRVTSQIERLRDSHRRAMQWDWCGAGSPPQWPSFGLVPTEAEFEAYKETLARTPVLPSYRTHSPDGKAFKFIAHAEALSNFLAHGEIAKAVACGRREWRDYVVTHNSRFKEFGRDSKKFVGFTNDVRCSNDQWGDTDDAEVIFWCSTDAERSARRICSDAEWRAQRVDDIGIDDYLSETETRIETAEDRDAVVYAVSSDYLRRIYGARNADCGADAVWAVEKTTHPGIKEHKGIESRYFVHLRSELVWAFHASMGELVDFALAHSTPTIARMSAEGIDALFDAFHEFRCEADAAQQQGASP